MSENLEQHKHGHHHKHRHPHGQEEPQPAPQPQQQGDELAAMRAERDDLMGRLQRVSADFLNYQKRVQRDIAHAHDYGNEELIKAILGVLDDMDRALHAANQHRQADDPLRQGMELVQQKFIQTLQKFGLGLVESEGKAFDPEKHAAMLQQPSDEHPPMTVLKELEKGYQLKGRTIRPAKVIVSTAPQKQEQQPKGDETDTGDARR